MKPISEHVNLDSKDLLLSDSKPDLSETAWRDIWRVGVLIFGDKWTMKHGERPSGEWTQVLLSFSDAQIATGIKRMRADAEARIRINEEAWPPIAFAFACYCKTPSSTYFPDAQKSLPPPRADKATRKSWVQKWKELLS